MKCIKIPQPLHLFWIRSSIDIWYFNKLKCGFLKKSFLMNAPLVVTFGWVHSKTNKKVWTVRWFNFYGNLCHFIAYPTWSSNIHASIFTCLTLFWNGFYADISKDKSCNRQSPYLSALDFWNSPVWNIMFDELDFFPSLNWNFLPAVACKIANFT